MKCLNSSDSFLKHLESDPILLIFKLKLDFESIMFELVRTIYSRNIEDFEAQIKETLYFIILTFLADCAFGLNIRIQIYNFLL